MRKILIGVVMAVGLWTTRAGAQTCIDTWENNTASLSCPSGQVLSMSFASYGTPSGSCGGGWSVGSCNSGISTSKMQELCNGKASCTVPVGNGTFGDPCSGVGKRLLAVATCGGSTPTPTGGGCSFDWQYYLDPNVNPDLRAAGISDASGAWSHYDTWGRNEGRRCNPGGCQPCSNSTSTTPTPTPTPTPTTSTGSQCSQAWEGGSTSLSCPAGQYLSVSFASYGTPSGGCDDASIGSCHAGNSLDVVRGACDGKGSCNVGASNGVFGDPCYGTGKRLVVKASCAGTATPSTPAYTQRVWGPMHAYKRAGDQVCQPRQDFMDYTTCVTSWSGSYSSDTGVCTFNYCYVTDPYAEGPQAGDILFHFPPNDLVRNTQSFPSPLASAQREIFGGNSPSHTSGCWFSSGNRCTWQVHNDVATETIGGALMSGQTHMGVAYPDPTDFSTSELRVRGMSSIAPFAALPGTAAVPVYTTHKGALDYYVVTQDIRDRVTNGGNWQFGGTLYRLGGVSHYLPRSQCSETLADVAQLSPWEGYRTMRFTEAGAAFKAPGIVQAIKNDLYANFRIKALRGKLEDVASWRHTILGELFIDAFGSVLDLFGMLKHYNVRDLLNALGRNADGSGSIGINAGDLIALTEIPHDQNLDQVRQGFRCTYGSTSDQVRCVGGRLVIAFDTMLDAVARQSVNLMLDSTDASLNLHVPAQGSGYYTSYTATGDLFKRLGRAASGQPCDPGNSECGFNFPDFREP